MSSRVGSRGLIRCLGVAEESGFGVGGERRKAESGRGTGCRLSFFVDFWGTWGSGGAALATLRLFVVWGGGLETPEQAMLFLASLYRKLCRIDDVEMTHFFSVCFILLRARALFFFLLYLFFLVTHHDSLLFVVCVCARLMWFQCCTRPHNKQDMFLERSCCRE